jgi:hypothetical protein
MDIQHYIYGEFENLTRQANRVLEGITHYESLWRPGPGCNSIALILFHCSRFEDMMIQTKFNDNKELWITEKWYEKFKFPPSEAGISYNLEGIASFAIPDFKDLKDYMQAVRAQSLNTMKAITPEKLDKMTHLPFGEFSLGAVSIMLISHQNGHMGEISYIRGMQHGLNK